MSVSRRTAKGYVVRGPLPGAWVEQEMDHFARIIDSADLCSQKPEPKSQRLQSGEARIGDSVVANVRLGLRVISKCFYSLAQVVRLAGRQRDDSPAWSGRESQARAFECSAH